MTALWIAAVGTTLLAALWLVWPLLRKDLTMAGESEYAISVYRDQLDEIARDHESGLIGDTERQAAEEEIERRALKMARQLDTSQMVGRRAPLVAALAGLVAIAGSLGLYAHYGAPALPDQPLAARQADILRQKAVAGDLPSQVALLAEQTKKNPESFEGWWQLGQAYAAIGNYSEAADAYRHATELSDDDPGVLVAYAEAVTLANGNRVVPAARISFEQVRRTRPKDPRARYYLALAKAQSQDFEGALADWMALKTESAKDAPWMTLVRRDIVNMARFLKRDLKTLLPDATEAELAKAGQPTDTTDPERLAARAAELDRSLGDDPQNWQGWIELANARARLGESAKAAEAIEAARERYKAAPFIQQKLDETARALGLDNIAAAEGTKRPDAAEVAAAAEMSDEDRSAMINGMVEGLAARLEENPEDADGWIMLVRSYSVLNAPEKARDALATARQHFGNNTNMLSRLDATAEELGIAAQ
ncbi:MAG: c-type cytochrome biogenesis protein CcmI [Hyphomicrobiales bacterium]|nr:c-type cytochrome biogenesis protein CcmI [Hyphomicrobiales bacterium]